MGAVLVSLAGVFAIAFSHSDSSDGGTSSRPFYGNFVVLATTLLYAVFEVLIKLKGPSENSPTAVADSCLLLGMMGLANMLLLWPGLFAVDALGVEHFETPSWHVVWMYALNGLLDTVFNGMLVAGIALTTPLFITCGTMLAIPCSIVYDSLFHSYKMTPMAIGGVAAVIVGFVLLNVKCKRTNSLHHDGEHHDPTVVDPPSQANIGKNDAS